MAPAGQIKTAPSSAGTHTHMHALAELSAPPADLYGAYKDNSCAPSTYIHMTNDNRSLSETLVIEKKISMRMNLAAFPLKSEIIIITWMQILFLFLSLSKSQKN